MVALLLSCSFAQLLTSMRTYSTVSDRAPSLHTVRKLLQPRQSAGEYLPSGTPKKMSVLPACRACIAWLCACTRAGARTLHVDVSCA